MLGLGLSNKYRYDHLVAKPDWIYDFEKLRLGLNLAGRNPDKELTNYLSLYSFFNKTFIKEL
jgi:hypothetical protein